MYTCIIIVRIFTVKPAHGTLKNQFQLVTIQMLPNDAGVYKCTLEYQLHLTAAVSSKVYEVIKFACHIRSTIIQVVI